MWWAYRQKYGSLFFGRRIEQGLGNLISSFLAFNGAKDVDAYAFMMHEDHPDEIEYSVDEMFEKGLGKLAQVGFPVLCRLLVK